MAKPTSSTVYIESLLLWIHDRPHMYCQHVGELDSVLWYLHMIWAKVANREKDYRTALELAGLKPLGILKEDERIIPIDIKAKTTKKVLRFWSKVNQTLGLKVRIESWQEPKHLT